jgi:UDP-3-O-[3-hydroxymyristoyl] glucosamine N-acyltransferase
MDTTVAEIAALVGGSVSGEPGIKITGLNGIKQAQSGDLTFLGSRKYLVYLESTRASVILVTPDFQIPSEIPQNRAFITVNNPYMAFLQALQHHSVHPATYHPTGVHPTAVIGKDVRLGAGVAIDANVRIADGAIIGDGAVIYAGVYIGYGCEIGEKTVIYPNVTLREHIRVGARCIIHAGAVLGTDGFGFAPMGGVWFKVPQTGVVVIGDDVEIGSNTCIDRATFGSTVIGSGTKIDNLVQIGHNVEIGEHCVISGMSGVAGSAVIGNHVIIAAQVGVADHSEVGDSVTVGGRSGVVGVIEAGSTVSGYPLVDHKQDLRILAQLRRLPEWPRKIRDLEQRIRMLEERLSGKSEDHSE